MEFLDKLYGQANTKHSLEKYLNMTVFTHSVHSVRIVLMLLQTLYNQGQAVFAKAKRVTK